MTNLFLFHEKYLTNASYFHITVSFVFACTENKFNELYYFQKVRNIRGMNYYKMFLLQEKKKNKEFCVLVFTFVGT